MSVAGKIAFKPSSAGLVDKGAGQGIVLMAMVMATPMNAAKDSDFSSLEFSPTDNNTRIRTVEAAVLDNIITAIALTSNCHWSPLVLTVERYEQEDMERSPSRCPRIN